MLRFSGHHLVWLSLFSGVIAVLYYYHFLTFELPWVPVSVVGTAVAFYVGFKNNQSYARMWEARKIWGGIVNESRSWAMMIDGFLTNQFRNSNLSASEINEYKKRLIYRHIAWLYVHRSQLLIPTPWEHIAQSGHVGKYADRYQSKYGIGNIKDDESNQNLEQFIPEEEYDFVTNAANTATQLINQQSRDLTHLREIDLIDDFRHMELENVLRTFYTLQGKNERIKKFPFPRQYANMSTYFIGIFIIMLPFSIIPAMMHGDITMWISIPVVTLIGWVYVVMEIIGDYSENPFSSMANDIPMLSLCRTIERDMREVLGETELPPSIEANDGVLM